MHIVASIHTSVYEQNRLTGPGFKVRGQICFFFIKSHVIQQKKAAVLLTSFLLL